ncbi:MAG: hypothetical protein ABJQ21_06945, partial [Roseibium sp.]
VLVKLWGVLTNGSSGPASNIFEILSKQASALASKGVIANNTATIIGLIGLWFLAFNYPYVFGIICPLHSVQFC